MAMTIGELVAVYEADDRAFQRGADRVDARLKGQTKSLASELKTQSAQAEKNFQYIQSLKIKESARLQREFERQTRERQRQADREVKIAEDQAKREAAAGLRAAQSLQRQRSAAIIGAGRSRDTAIQSLAMDIPGGRFLARFGNIKRDLDEVRAAEAIAGAATSKLSTVVTALGGTAVVATAGIAALGLGVVAVGGGLLSLVKHAADASGNLFDLSQKTGISVENLSALKIVAEQTGSSIESIAGSLAIFQKNIQSAVEGNKKMSATFRALGIDTTSTESALQSAFQQLSQLPVGYQQTALAQRLFGRSGKDMLAIIKETNGDFEATKKHLRDLGILIGTDAARNADIFNDKYREVELQISAIARTIGEALLPIATQSLGEISQSLAENKDQWRTWGSEVASATSEVIGFIKQLNSEFNQLSAWLDKQAGFHPFSNIGGDALDKAAGLVPYGSVAPRSSMVDYADLEGRVQAASNGPKQRTGIDPSLLATGRTGSRSSGESAARRAARQALELAQIDLRDAESIYNQKLSIERRSYEQSLENLEKYTANSLQLENKRYEQVKTVYEKERQAVAGLRDADRKMSLEQIGDALGQATPGSFRFENLVKLKEVAQKEQQAQRDHQETVNQIKADGFSKGQDIQRRAAEDTIRVQEEVNRTLEAALRAQVETGARTFAEVEDILFQGTQNVQRLTAERLRKDLEASLGGDIAGLAGALKPKIDELMKAVLSGDEVSAAGLGESIVGAAFDPAAAQTVLRQIQTFLEQVKQANLKHNSDSANARADDKQNAISYVEQLRSIYRGVIELNQEIEQSRIDSFSTNNYRRGESIEAQRSLDRSRELVRSGEAIRELAHRREIAQLNKNETEKAKILAALKGAEEAEYRASNARLDVIDREAAEKRREYLVEVADDLAGIFNDIRSGLGDGWENFWDNLLNTVKRTVDSILDELTRVTFESLITGENRGSNAGGLVGSVVNAITKPIFGNTPTSTGFNQGSLASKGIFEGRATGGYAGSGIYELGEKGREYVIDADSTAALGGDFLARLNRANSRADASMMLAGLGQSSNRPAPVPAQEGNNFIMAIGPRAVADAMETYGRTAKGKRAQVMQARYDRKTVRRF